MGSRSTESGPGCVSSPVKAFVALTFLPVPHASCIAPSPLRGPHVAMSPRVPACVSQKLSQAASLPPGERPHFLSAVPSVSVCPKTIFASASVSKAVSWVWSSRAVMNPTVSRDVVGDGCSFSDSVHVPFCCRFSAIFLCGVQEWFFFLFMVLGVHGVSKMWVLTSFTNFGNSLVIFCSRVAYVWLCLGIWVSDCTS